jgi:hypothetical protein
MAIDKKLIDQLLADYKKPEDIIVENGLALLVRRKANSEGSLDFEEQPVYALQRLDLS